MSGLSGPICPLCPSKRLENVRLSSTIEACLCFFVCASMRRTWPRPADAVAESVGTKTPEIVRMFIHQVARTGKVPISMSAQDELLDVKRRNRILRELDDAEGW